MLRNPHSLPIGFLLNNLNTRIYFTGYEGGTYSLTFTTTTVTVNHEYYGHPIYIFGIK